MGHGAWSHAIVEHILTVSALTPKQVHTILLKLENSYSHEGNATNGSNGWTLLSCTVNGVSNYTWVYKP